MNFNRIRIGEVATNKLRVLKARTGLTPNILCRVGFCFSLQDDTIPKPKDYDETGQEFNRFTLLGEWDGIYVALLKQRLIKDNLDIDKDFLPMFRAHLNRGVLTMYPRIKSIGDWVNLLPGEVK